MKHIFGMSYKKRYLIHTHIPRIYIYFQSSRLEDQRSPLPAASTLQDAEEERSRRANGNAQSGSTMPEEDLFALIQKLQAGRMEDQRASGPGKAKC